MTTTTTEPNQPQTCDGRGFLDGEPCPWTGPDDRWPGDLARCVFHSEDPNKPHDRIRAEWDRMAADRAFDCRGWVIPFDVELTGEITLATFVGATFSGNALFAGVTFRGNAGFQRASFARDTTFDGTQFGATASFRECKLNLLRFHRCPMWGVALHNALGIAEAEYDACEWDERPGRVLIAEERDAFGTRPGLPDGVAPHSPAAFQRAERVYREVRRSLETRKQYREANLFSYRELEMRRLALGAVGTGPLGWFRQRGLSLEALYKGVSDYGEDWKRPLVVLGFSLVLWPFLFALGGIRIDGDWIELPLPDLSPDLGQLWGWLATSAESYFSLLGLTVRSAALMDTPDKVDLLTGAQAFQVALRLLSPFLAFQTALGIRRRFRR